MNIMQSVCAQLSTEQLNVVEDAVIDTILTTVLRLPEMNFRSVKFTKVTDATPVCCTQHLHALFCLVCHCCSHTHTHTRARARVRLTAVFPGLTR